MPLSHKNSNVKPQYYQRENNLNTMITCHYYDVDREVYGRFERLSSSFTTTTTTSALATAVPSSTPVYN